MANLIQRLTYDNMTFVKSINPRIVTLINRKYILYESYEFYEN